MSELRETVKAKYGKAAQAVLDGGGKTDACCTTSCCGGSEDPITTNLYDEADKAALPEKAVAASLGCGNPTALAELRQGDVVLDLGSGGGIDVLLSARRVGPTGKAYGLDMTDAMLALARQNQLKAGVTNVEFLKGEIEQVPLPSETVDVIISNCVVNLSSDKDRVFAEAFRVLKPGGRLAISDVVSQRDVPASIRQSMEHWIGCIAGALDVRDYRARLERAGFTGVSFEITREYRSEDAGSFLVTAGVTEEDARAADKAFASAFVRATRPAA
ncbi:MAG: arsenite methyltransferase [Acidobacteriota bacterium]|nr:arsenite methyltransferase [Acidobacteriota bacterium]